MNERKKKGIATLMQPMWAEGASPWYLLGGTPLIAYQPKGAASAAAALVNLANPGTYDASNGTAYPAWNTAIGWTFTAASTQFLNIGGGTGPILSGAATFLVRTIPTNDGLAKVFIGTTGTGAALRLSQKVTTKTIQLGTAATLIGDSATAVTTEKVVGVTYSAAGAFIFYLNGVADGTGTSDQTIDADTDAIGRRNTNYMGGVISLLACWDVVLTPTQMLEASTKAFLI